MNDFVREGKGLFLAFPIKFTGSVVFLSLGQHALLFLCFSALVALDVLSRWLAISAEMLRKEGRRGPTLFALARGIPRARRLGLIKSSVMKERGASKLMMYAFCVFAAAAADAMLSISGNPSGMVPLVVSYLTSTEALSVVENLSEAGLSSMKRLLEQLKGVRK
nr:phage holin family protein [uncultured Dialister sp.]